MGLWKRIRDMFAGAGSKTSDGGLYYYVRIYKMPHQESPDDEIVKLRINPMNDLSTTDDGQYFVRKVVAGSRTFKRAEVELYFDKQRRLIDYQVDNGDLVEEEDYLAYEGEDS